MSKSLKNKVLDEIIPLFIKEYTQFLKDKADVSKCFYP